MSKHNVFLWLYGTIPNGTTTVTGETAEIVVVSDSHLGPGNPAADRNWDAVVAYVADQRPVMSLHLGDLTLHGMEERSRLTGAVGPRCPTAISRCSG